MEQWFNVGKIVNTHGVNGEVRVISITDFKEERYKKGAELFLFTNNKEPISLIVNNHRQHKNFDLLKFTGYNNLNEVEWMKGGQLKVNSNQLGELATDEYYFHEIIGSTVFTLNNDVVGTVIEILTPGANDVWVVKTATNKNVYIPYIKQVVTKVDVDKKQIFIDPLEGMLSE